MRKVKLIVQETYQGKRKSEDVFAAVLHTDLHMMFSEEELQQRSAHRHLHHMHITTEDFLIPQSTVTEQHIH